MDGGTYQSPQTLWAIAAGLQAECNGVRSKAVAARDEADELERGLARAMTPERQAYRFITAEQVKLRKAQIKALRRTQSIRGAEASKLWQGVCKAWLAYLAEEQFWSGHPLEVL